ncbi:MAG: cytochrome b/b6 domain-containing protein [Mesorhizobium sp.]|nr:cytochrome b/b6 domain-containing protein [Mesorhizobium sp.]
MQKRRRQRIAGKGLDKVAAKRKVTGYSPMQVALHWIVVVLVAFQFVAHDGIEESWRAWLRDGMRLPTDGWVLAYLHIGAGILILILALARLYLRVTRGAPPPPADEPRLLQWAAEAIHGLIYLLLILLPVTGAAAWFFSVRTAANVHDILQNVLLLAIALHVSGALFQHFVRRSQVLMRMFRPDRS